MSKHTVLLAASRAAIGLSSTAEARFLIHPLEVAQWVELGAPQAGVHVMERVGGPSVPLADWLKQHGTPAKP